MSVCKLASVVSDSLQPCRLWPTGQASLSVGFSRQVYCSEWPCPPPGGLPDPGIRPASPVSPALQAGSVLLSHW